MTNLGFTGNQSGLTRGQRAAVASFLVARAPGEFHQGDCVGSDAAAAELARAAGWTLVGHPPVDSRKRAFVPVDRELAPLPYLERNRAIVDATDLLLATPSGPEVLRSGTWATVRYARKLRRTVVIVWPSGELTVERDPDRIEP